MHKYNVLVTDDNLESAEVLEEGLALHDYNVRTAHTGQAALDACSEGDIDLVLLDVCLPDIDGFEVCRILKANPATQDIAVIFVTVKSEAEHIAMGLDLGAVHYITKPYNLPMVMVCVDAVARNGNTLREPSIDSTHTDSLTGLCSRQFLLARLKDEVEKGHRHDFPVSCAIFDIEEGRGSDVDMPSMSIDDLLIEMAISMKNASRATDVIARYDGNMFAALLPHTHLGDAIGYANKILAELDASRAVEPGISENTRFTAGIATSANGSRAGADYMLGEAMRGLLQAKSGTKGRVVARNLPPA